MNTKELKRSTEELNLQMLKSCIKDLDLIVQLDETDDAHFLISAIFSISSYIQEKEEKEKRND